jgi:hypothetical protein
VAKYDKDGIWYRGQILKICDRLRAIVLFFDYGNKQLVPNGQIKSIDAEFMQVPSFAYHCRLGGVASFRVWTQEEIRNLKAEPEIRYYPRPLLIRIPQANILCDWWKIQLPEPLSSTKNLPRRGIKVAVLLKNQSVSS